MRRSGHWLPASATFLSSSNHEDSSLAAIPAYGLRRRAPRYTETSAGGLQMTKAELIETIARATGQQKKIVATTVELTFEQIARAIRKDKRFRMPGFGTFTIRRRKARGGFNPNKMTKIAIPAARTVGFRPAPKLKKAL
jgi:nucleoid DNA-binding protein